MKKQNVSQTKGRLVGTINRGRRYIRWKKNSQPLSEHIFFFRQPTFRQPTFFDNLFHRGRCVTQRVECRFGCRTIEQKEENKMRFSGEKLVDFDNQEFIRQPTNSAGLCSFEKKRGKGFRVHLFEPVNESGRYRRFFFCFARSCA